MSVQRWADHLRNWGIRAGLSILDHGLYSGANFILSILLARWLTPSHYGVYSIALALYQFAYQTHNAIALEPITVLGPAGMQDRLPDYLRDQVKLHFVISLVAGASVCILGVVVLLFNPTLGQVIISMGVVLSFLLLPLLMRRIYYIFQRADLALIGSIVYGATLAIAIWVLGSSTTMPVQLAFPALGLAGFTSGLYLLSQVPARRFSASPIAETWAGNWGFGRWLFYASLLIAVAAQIQTFVVGVFLGLGDAGAFRAMQNFVQPIILLFTAMSALALPSLARDFGEGNVVRLKRKGEYLFVLFLLVSGVFELLLLLFGARLEALVYGGKYSSYLSLIPLWGLVPIAAAITYVYYFLLQAIQRPRAVLAGSVVWSVTSTASSVLLSLKWGIAGATWSVVLGYLLSGVAFAFFYHRYLSDWKTLRNV